MSISHITTQDFFNMTTELRNQLAALLTGVWQDEFETRQSSVKTARLQQLIANAPNQTDITNLLNSVNNVLEGFAYFSDHPTVYGEISNKKMVSLNVLEFREQALRPTLISLCDMLNGMDNGMRNGMITSMMKILILEQLKIQEVQQNILETHASVVTKFVTSEITDGRIVFLQECDSSTVSGLSEMGFDVHATSEQSLTCHARTVVVVPSNLEVIEQKILKIRGNHTKERDSVAVLVRDFDGHMTWLVSVHKPLLGGSGSCDREGDRDEVTTALQHIEKELGHEIDLIVGGDFNARNLKTLPNRWIDVTIAQTNASDCLQNSIDYFMYLLH
jgi:hypothetical protein